MGALGGLDLEPLGALGWGAVLSSHCWCGLLCEAPSGVFVCSLGLGGLCFGGFRPVVTCAELPIVVPTLSSYQFLAITTLSPLNSSTNMQGLK